MTDVELYPFRMFGLVVTTLFALAGLAVVLRPQKKIVEPGHRVGNFIIWMMGERKGMRVIRLIGWVMLIGGGVGLLSVLGALMSAA